MMSLLDFELPFAIPFLDFEIVFVTALHELELLILPFGMPTIVFEPQTSP